MGRILSLLPSSSLPYHHHRDFRTRINPTYHLRTYVSTYIRIYSIHSSHRSSNQPEYLSTISTRYNARYYTNTRYNYTSKWAASHLNQQRAAAQCGNLAITDTMALGMRAGMEWRLQEEGSLVGGMEGEVDLEAEEEMEGEVVEVVEVVEEDVNCEGMRMRDNTAFWVRL
ncbi:hypothetical protein P153DRAFT_38537 [Dothidotthia symphoricarpi CBS 119687]|uniref:Uncharacterized protein n=1 Tax=Dothidotthia symphoricarpi CBS 119687 TaxID=1392245 RepID=A0A6A6AC50_9PLEO|nr:uncharacterized protein P153DRAFT_38537 [Dothidotthia symphoricarpi CBS 119687]KAF2128478.1 hypothetical protein P153DRAFT_38537 [Dothidotthia symphoricarpi CBS 119687]